MSTKIHVRLTGCFRKNLRQLIQTRYTIFCTYAFVPVRKNIQPGMMNEWVLKLYIASLHIFLIYSYAVNRRTKFTKIRSRPYVIDLISPSSFLTKNIISYGMMGILALMKYAGTPESIHTSINQRVFANYCVYTSHTYPYHLDISSFSYSSCKKKFFTWR